MMELQKLALKAILNAIDESGFRVILYTENGKECGFEIEDWTPRGVDMIHFLDLRDAENPYNPFSVLDALWRVSELFDPDEETEVHMQGKDFHTAFSMVIRFPGRLTASSPISFAFVTSILGSRDSAV